VDEEALSNRAIVGMVKYKPSPESTARDLYKVSLSAAVNKFGPLAYQIAMTASNGWLRSDLTLSKHSFKVWNTMYRMPDLYERKWLGDFPNIKAKDIIAALKASDYGNEFYYENHHAFNKITSASEEQFKAVLNSKGKDLADFGNLYAYKLINPDPKVEAMFDEGKQLIAEIERRGYTSIAASLFGAVLKFFDRRYR